MSDEMSDVVSDVVSDTSFKTSCQFVSRQACLTFDEERAVKFEPGLDKRKGCSILKMKSPACGAFSWAIRDSNL
jgi:hypothetical protein